MQIFKLGKLFKPNNLQISYPFIAPIQFSKPKISFSTAQEPVTIYIPDQPENPDDKLLPFYPMFPIKNALFPQASYFTKISPAQQELLRKMKIKYVTAFLTKEAIFERSTFSSFDAQENLQQSDEIQTEDFVDPEENGSKKGGRGRARQNREGNQEAGMFGNQDGGGLIVYDENITVGYGQKLEPDENGVLVVKEHPEIFTIPKLNPQQDVFQLGTLCRITTQKLPSEDASKPNECFAVLKSMHRVKIDTEVTQKNEVTNLYAKNSKRTSPPKPQGMLSIFYSQPEEPAEETDDSKISEQLIDKFLDNFTFVKVEHFPMNRQIKDADLNETFKVKMTSLLSYYMKLRSKVQVNVPELYVTAEDPKTIDIICGFLSATTLFSKLELQTLLQTISASQRLDLCLKYFFKYEKKFLQEWDQLQKVSTLPMDPNSQKQQFADIYNFLKRSSDNPFKKPIIEKIKQNMAGKKFPPALLRQIEDELSRFTELHESHPDYNVYRSYLELVTSLPFGQRSPDNFDIKHARSILDEDHYGLEDVKNRILEFIAVAKLKGSIRGKSLLLVGPPGVGKTSIGSSIARCLGRKFLRIALGGESDVSVLKGHRRTYVGAYPGRIVQGLKNGETDNPVILLDEVDKISTGMRGNIQDTLLEILDPVQNSSFTDHYLDTPIDLSNCLFICTANLTETIHPAVLDRMEVIHLSGYTKEEKKQIMLKYLFPRALETTGLKEKHSNMVNFTDAAVDALLVNYAREAGVRNLERLVRRICEKITLQYVRGNVSETKITENDLKKYIGLPTFGDQRIYKEIPPPGIIVGLAYNAYGGSIIYIETIKSNFEVNNPQQSIEAGDPSKKAPRRGVLKITGSLGDVMQESTQIAYSYAKYVLSSMFKNDYLEINDVHIHFPDGASKKDGPSAGLAITSSLISLAMDAPTNSLVAMTGEISLTGKALKIGGVKEKVLAAKRENIKKLIFPNSNKEDIDDLKHYIKEGIEFTFVENYLDVIKAIFPQLMIQSNTSRTQVAN